MIKFRFRSLVFLCVLALVAPLFVATSSRLVTAQDTALPALAETMPIDVVAFVSAEVDLRGDQFSELTRLAAQTLIPGAGETAASIVEQLVSLLALLPSDVRTVLEGEIGIGVLGIDGPDLNDVLATEPFVDTLLSDYAIVLHPERAGDARQVAERWFTALLADAGIGVESTQADVTLILNNPDPRATTTPGVPTTVIFSGDYILLGNGIEQLQPFVDAVEGNTSTLADSPELAKLAGALPKERLLFGYLNGMSIAGGTENVGVSMHIDPPFGLAAFTIAADPAGLHFESVALPLPGTALRGSANSSPDFATRIPESSLAMFAGDNLGSSWFIEQLERVVLSQLMSAMGGGAVDLSDTSIDDQFRFLAMLTGIDFKADLMDQLQSGYGGALLTLDMNDPLASSAVVVSELADVDQVSIGVTSIGPLLQAAVPGAISVTTSSVAGQTVTNVALTDGDQTITIRYGVLDNELMIGLGDGIATYVQNSGPSLAQNARYQVALGQLPPIYDGVVYIDTQAIARSIGPEFIQSWAADSEHAFIRCLAGGAQSTSSGTPIAVEDSSSGLICGLIRTIFGEEVLQNLFISQLPGPFAAVSYSQDGMQRVSAILMVGASA